MKKLLSLATVIVILLAINSGLATATTSTSTNPLNLTGTFKYIPYAPSSDGNLCVYAQINGGKTVKLIVDTGSSELCVGINNMGAYTSLGTGSYSYSSSSTTESGDYSNLTVSFGTVGAKDKFQEITTAKLQGLAVTNHPNAAMMGVGFGPLANIALFNIIGQAQSYILGPPGTGIYIGISNATAIAQGFSSQQLTAAPTGGKYLWNFPTAQITITTPSTTYTPVSSNLLMDTGYPGLFLAMPSPAPSTGTIPAGTTITVAPTNITPTWTITIGGTSSQIAPTGNSVWNEMKNDTPFINTGLSSLAQNNFWCLYDGANGYWGLKQPAN